MQIPGGLRFYQPETKWSPSRFPSFNSLVAQVLAHRQANPAMAQKHGWNMTVESIEAEVDAYNAALCRDNRWFSYISAGEGELPPLPQRPSSRLLGKLGSVVAGAQILVEWLAEGAESVPPDVAEKRASICLNCPLNQKGDLTSFFTVPVSNAIRMALNRRSEWKLSTRHDSELGVCGGCSCPLKLKIHMPLDRIRRRMDEETKASLHADCWITKNVL